MKLQNINEPVSGLIHEYIFRHIAFEFAPTGHKKVLIFVGGLLDGLLTVPYLVPLAKELDKIGYSLIQIQISSSHIGWGTGSLSRDSSEIAKLVNYLKSDKGGSRQVIGLMGHSTGCQNTIHYFTKQPRNNRAAKYPEIDFGILQAPVSDRISAAENLTPEQLKESLELADSMISNGQSQEIMPQKFSKHFFNVPINAYRWKSLMAIRGDDDFFSPDLEDSDFKSTFGSFNKPFLVLYSGDDEYVPKSLNKEELMKRWENVTGSNWSKYSKIVEGAKHNLGNGSTEGAQIDAINTVIKFINSI